MIINDEVYIFKILEQYQLDSDETQLKENILELIRQSGKQ